MEGNLQIERQTNQELANLALEQFDAYKFRQVCFNTAMLMIIRWKY